MRRPLLPVLVLGSALVLSACGMASPQTSPGTSAPTPSPEARHVQPSGAPVEVTTGLTLPWSIVRVDDDETLVSQRDDARILSVASNRSPVEVGVVPGVSHGGEGGLLGLAHLAGEGGDAWLYAFITTDTDNR